MDKREKEIDNFFNHYAEVFNNSLKEGTPNIEQTAELFSTCFIAANPSGVNCGQNDAAFRDAMQKGYLFYKNIGITKMEIVSKNIMLLDDFHSMARIHWKSHFLDRNGSKGSVEFENIYLTQTKDNKPKVFAYVTGDEQAALKKAGLI